MSTLAKKHGPKVSGPVICCVLDGVGLGQGDAGDAVALAHTPQLDALMSGMSTTLFAHGRHVGLPTDKDMGNSEVGHNALGAGRVFEQGALLVNKAIESGALYDGETWQAIMKRVVAGEHTLHFLGLLSDGNVHSHIDHLLAMTRKAASSGVKTIRVHVLLDGRDVAPTSALQYLEQLEDHLAALQTEYGISCAIASGGGRSTTTMDRYESDWSIVKRGYWAHVHGEGRGFASAKEAVETMREESPGIIDQDLSEFVIIRDGKPIGQVRDGDAVINFNFRGDRALMISRAFERDDFSAFDRDSRPDCFYAGMMEYDGDEHIPSQYLVQPPTIDRTMGEFLAASGVKQLAISETQKYGHVTYFWNGNRSGYFDKSMETYVEVPSDTLPFAERPWMKAAEITDSLVGSLKQDGHGFVRVNYANGDMVGHTGDIDATRVAVEAVDLQLRRLMKFVDKVRGALVVTADHGNADDMVQRDKQGQPLYDDGAAVMRTSHSLNRVPLAIYGPEVPKHWKLQSSEDASIANIASTCLELLGFAAPEDYYKSLLVSV